MECGKQPSPHSQESWQEALPRLLLFALGMLPEGRCRDTNTQCNANKGLRIWSLSVGIPRDQLRDKYLPTHTHTLPISSKCSLRAAKHLIPPITACLLSMLCSSTGMHMAAGCPAVLNCSIFPRTLWIGTSVVVLNSVSSMPQPCVCPSPSSVCCSRSCPAVDPAP